MSTLELQFCVLRCPQTPAVGVNYGSFIEEHHDAVGSLSVLDSV